jgi:hypothetical protein
MIQSRFSLDGKHWCQWGIPDGSSQYYLCAVGSLTDNTMNYFWVWLEGETRWVLKKGETTFRRPETIFGDMSKCEPIPGYGLGILAEPTIFKTGVTLIIKLIDDAGTCAQTSLATGSTTLADVPWFAPF